jgi:glycerate-2-kinase
LTDALAISDAWSSELNLRELLEQQLGASGALEGVLDVVALGKAAREMASALHDVVGERVQRQLIIVDEGPAFSLLSDVEFVIGDHPLPGLGSLMAGERLVEFLEKPTTAECTIFLVSGGASSLCALPESPVTLEDLHELFQAVLAAGADITTLNQLRAACSRIAGGAILRRVRTPRSLTLVMVDNVVSGERWVASGLTFDYAPTRGEVATLLETVGRGTGRLAEKILEARERRGALMSAPVKTVHENRVIAAPSQVLSAVVKEAARRGYQVIDAGASLHGDVHDVVTLMAEQLSKTARRGPFCVVGVGEVTLRVRGSGNGGRCQDFAWRMADVLDGEHRDVVALARATDGRDYVKGIAGGWVDATTGRRARERGINWSTVVEASDSFSALHDLGQLIAGGRTGWNLCDVYLVVGAS